MKQQHNHSVSGLFVFLLLGLFAVMSVFMVLLGSQLYHRTIEEMESNRKARILSSYIRSMVRSGDQASGVSVENLSGVDCISMRDSFDEEAYVTRLYVYDGMLYEQFGRARYDFDPEAGEEICAAASMSARIENGILNVTAVETDGTERSIQVYLASPQE